MVWKVSMICFIWKVNPTNHTSFPKCEFFMLFNSYHFPSDTSKLEKSNLIQQDLFLKEELSSIYHSPKYIKHIPTSQSELFSTFSYLVDYIFSI